MLTASPHHYRLTHNQLLLWLKFIEYQVGFVLPNSQINWVRRIVERYLQTTKKTNTELLETVMQDKALYHQLFDDILIPRTQFFRHQESFAYIADYLQCWQCHHGQSVGDGVKPFTAWSVGCSTGQETLSLALTLRQYLDVYPVFQVYGSDFHQQCLQTAIKGEYAIDELDFIPEIYHTYLTIKPHGFFANENVQQHIAYFSQNIVDFSQAIPVLPQQCQIILCKNVLIYFRQFGQRDIINYLTNFLADDGIMVFGAGEVLPFNNLSLIRLPTTKVNAYCKSSASDWIKQLTR